MHDVKDTNLLCFNILEHGMVKIMETLDTIFPFRVFQTTDRTLRNQGPRKDFEQVEKKEGKVGKFWHIDDKGNQRP